MISTAIGLGVILLASAPPRPELLVIDRAHEQPADCQAPPAGWDHHVPMDEAPPALVASDFERYFGGLSAQLTSVLDAAWKGAVWLCTPADEKLVLAGLVQTVLRPHRGTASDPSPALPNGADQLLRAFASPALREQIESFQPRDRVERARQGLAREIVSSQISRRKDAGHPI